MKSVFTILFISITIILSTSPTLSLDTTKCRGLAMEGNLFINFFLSSYIYLGGGDKGAFEAGAFKKFV